MKKLGMHVSALALLVLSGLAAPAMAAIECDCPATGAYVDPSEPAPISTSPLGASPNGKYSLAATGGGGSVDIIITRVAGGSVVLTRNIPANSQWGFSPDDDRFVYHYLTGGQHSVVLLDLAGPAPATPIWQGGPVGTSSSRVLFSALGNHLFYSALPFANQSQLTVVDARTGAVRHNTAVSFVDVPSNTLEDEFGVQLWGFSPDSLERTFVYGTVSSASQVLLEVVNLAIGQVVTEVPLNAVAAFWQFSPCGDRLGLVEQPFVNMMITSLRRTANGSKVTERTDPVAYVAFSASAGSHTATIDGTPHALAPNTAGAACPASPQLQSLVISPHKLLGGASATGTVSLTGTVTGSAVLVPLVHSQTSLVTIPASVSITAGNSSATFNISTTVVNSAVVDTVVAELGAFIAADTLRLEPPPVNLLHAVIGFPSVYAGQTASMQLAIDRPAPAGGIAVTLGSGNPAVAQVPESVTIDQGLQGKAVSITTTFGSPNARVGISASYRGVTLTDTVNVLAGFIASFDSGPKSCLAGGETIALYVEIFPAAGAGGATVSLSSSDNAVVSVPPSLLIAEGSTSAFAVATAGKVTEVQSATLSAQMGTSIRQLTLTVLPPEPWKIVDSGGLVDYEDFLDPLALNDLDHVIARAANCCGGGDLGVVRWANGIVTLIPELADSSPHDLNNAGVIVGEHAGQAFFFDGATLTHLAPGTASAINESGVIVGESNGHAFRYQTVLEDLGTLGGATSVATALNESGEIVGNSVDAAGDARAFRWTALGGMEALALPPGTVESDATGINAAGVIIGRCFDIFGFGTACRWAGGVPTLFDEEFTPLAINDAGQIAGAMSVSFGGIALWEAEGRTRLDSISTIGCDWDDWLSGPDRLFLNSSGHVVGRARIGGAADIYHGFRIEKLQLTPTLDPGPVTPPPTTAPPAALAIAPYGSNPAEGRITVRCALPRPGSATVELLDVAGRQLALLRLEMDSPGVRLLEIGESERLGPGIYFLRLTQGAHTARTRISLVR